MITVRVGLGSRSYNIYIQSGLARTLPHLVRPFKKSGRCLVLTDRNILRRYPALVARLREKGTYVLALPPGEKSKTLATVERILTFMLRRRFDRGSLLVALGGGVVGDLGGFAASVYMRGIPYLQVPTTLLSQVDSSVGGKTGVNHSLGKNMIGTFHQPRAVFIDTAFLRTLPRRELMSGFAEVVKHGVIRSRRLFSYIEKNLDRVFSCQPRALETVVAESCRIKAAVVARDEREKDLRAILNFGHTYGHAIEAATGYARYAHGEAVMLGMAAATITSVRLGLIREKEAGRLLALLRRAGLPQPAECGEKELYQRLFSDKKTRGSRLNMVFPVRVGQAELVHSPDKAAVLAGIRSVLASNGKGR